MTTKFDAVNITYVDVDSLEELGRVVDYLPLRVLMFVSKTNIMGDCETPMLRFSCLAAVMML